jgi:hypothetical protein
MAEPCQQAEKIGRIEATLTFFQDEAKKREVREERIVKALEDIAKQGAAQGATLQSHSDTLMRFEKAFMESFTRLRKVEGSNLIARIFSGRRGPYIFAGLIGLSVYGLVHMDAITLERFVKLIIKALTGGSL